MLRLAGREADGAIINWLSASDVSQVVPVVTDAAGGDEREIVARIFCCPSENTDAVRAAARYAIAAYLNVPVYAEFHRWLGPWRSVAGHVGRVEGRRPQGRAGRDPRPGRRRPHRARIGRPKCRAKIQAYFDNGVTTTSLAIMPLDPELELLAGRPRPVAQRDA